jgi:hydrogenase/urease accessory protein HupE
MTTMLDFPKRFRATWLTPPLVLLMLLLVAFPPAARAHLMPEKSGTVHIVDKSAFVVVSIPVSAFHGLQTEPDGTLTPEELQACSAIMQQQFETRFLVRDTALGGTPVVTWVLMPQDGNDNQPRPRTNYVVVLQRINFTAVPTHLSLYTDFFAGSQGDKMLTLKVSRDQEVQMLVLKPGTARFELLPGKLHLLETFIATGVDHILTGPDHLLFLLTILVGAASWRYWLSAVSAFTLAHSLTLTLSALGYVHLPSSIIEPGIAASIVLMALDNLFRPNARRSERVVLIFLCGLLHGLGFASSIADMGLDTTHRLLSLLGFNTGIELGQFIFLASIAVVLFVARRLVPRTLTLVPLPRLASVTACVLGAILFVQRVASSF